MQRSTTWVLVADRVKDHEHKMWITPSRTRRKAKRDLAELAVHITSGLPLSTFPTTPMHQHIQPKLES